jgi:hypothetical protein
LTGLSGRSHLALDRLDRFYATERVANFVGHGLTLYAANGQPRSPFLDARWISAVRSIPRSERLGSNHHRALILATDERLARYPIHDESRMSPRASRRYWLHAKEVGVGYSPFGRLARSPDVIEMLSQSPHISAFIEDRDAIRRHGDPALVDLLLTLHFAGEAGEDAARRGQAAAASRP